MLYSKSDYSEYDLLWKRKLLNPKLFNATMVLELFKKNEMFFSFKKNRRMQNGKAN